MALVDPITVAAAAPTPALTFSKVKDLPFGAERRDVTNRYTLTFTHSESPQSGERHYMKIAQDVDAVSPYTGGTSKQIATVSISASFPPFGWTAAQKAALVKALTDTLADADVTVPKFLAFES